MKPKPLFPSITALRSDLVREQKALRRMFARSELIDSEQETAGTDCRLRILPNGRGWQLLTGSADYDQDHSGYWGAFRPSLFSLNPTRRNSNIQKLKLT